MAYFLISVSNRTNLELCIKYSMAGFTNSKNGLWTFLEIEEGDYMSFLYGARVFNLYKVTKKLAFKSADKLPPWQHVTFKMSGKTYYFPFRLYLEPIRRLNEPMVRPEFAYVAENLLLRGGYRKTHFQADTVTFYGVSNMGEVYGDESSETLEIDAEAFVPKIVFNRDLQDIPERFYFQELILQSLIRKYLSNPNNLRVILEYLNSPDLDAENFEVLGEKALPEGHVDLFIKNKHPTAINNKIITEVKVGRSKSADIVQLKNYMGEIGEECVGGILIAREHPKKTAKDFKNKNIVFMTYEFDNINRDSAYTYTELLNKLSLKFKD